MVKPLTYICTLKILKPCGNISKDFDLTKSFFLKSGFNSTLRDHTQFRNAGSNHKTDGLFVPEHLPQTSSTLVPPQNVVSRKHFGNDDKALEELKKMAAGTIFRRVQDY